ncbi:RNA-binding protein 44 isoform X2 [Anguilla rostrata]|uniref:RNA-binding protein 44 isoform X2 n=1 Tax=Anguilla rostrata TaxID=7938 RepID=UPI0030D2FE3B
MWSPPFMILPFGSGRENVLEAQRHFETRLAVASGMFPWCFVPMRPCTNHLPSHRKQVPAEILSNEEAKKIILIRSVFDLVKSTQFLELTDSKLLGWYLTLPAEDRKLIQDEGGLLQFLQKHPALDVTRNFVYIKRQSLEECTHLLSSEMSTDLNKSRRPTYYGVSLCKSCGASIPFSTTTCRLCCAPAKKPEEKFYLSDQGRELRSLPTGAREELIFGPSGVQDAPGERRTAQGPADQSLLLVSEESFRSACGAAEGPPGLQGEQAHILSQLWDEEVEKKSAGVTVYKDSSAQASFALDAQLERHGKTPQGLVGSPERGGHRGEEPADVTGLETETLPEYCSFDSTGLGTSYRDCSDTSQSGGSYHSGSDPAAGPREAEGTDSYGSADSTPCRGEYADWTRGDRLDDFGVEEDSRHSLKNEEFHSVMEAEPLEADGATWVSSWTPTPQGLEMDPRMSPSPAGQSHGSRGEVAGVCNSPRTRGGNWACPEREFACSSPGNRGRNSSLAALYDSRSTAGSPQVTVNQSVDVSRDFRASYTCARATEARWSGVSRASNTEPPGATRNAAVNTARAPPGQDRGTQTTSVPTAEKFAITEVCMADLDYFTEEFIKLHHAQDELKLLQVKLACSEQEAVDGGCRRDGACECSQRAVRAELRLLALQHAMCQQHCWRRYYTSPEGECSILSMEAPSENIKNVLQDLEEDYCEMKRKILSGVPLDELRPLSVNSQMIGSEALYVPSQIIKDCLSEEEAVGAEQGEGLQPAPQDGGEGERGGGSVASRSTESLQTEQSDAPPAVKPQPDSAKSGKADTPLPRQTDPPVCPPIGPPIASTAGHKPGGARDPESSEAWYDAEEEFGPVPRGQKGTRREGVEEGTISKGKKDLNCFLCVTGLPDDTTEDEVRSTFRKYQVSEVNVTTFSNNLRVAMMTVGCPRLAEAAVREVNGRTLRGQVVKVTSVCRPCNPSSERPGGGGGAKTSSRTFLRARRTATTQTPKNPKSILSVTAKPLQHRLEKLTNVQDTPTASGTCVPPHYATMGSFDTLMARLTERHPEAGRERIVKALVELREQNQGLLSGLPLKTIVDMTSDLLTRPSSSAVV